jgi:hypothetical protein
MTETAVGVAPDRSVYLTDKREVLFAGAEHFVKHVVDAVRAAPRSSAPLDAVLTGLRVDQRLLRGALLVARSCGLPRARGGPSMQGCVES